MPDTQAKLAELARTRPLPNADFAQHSTDDPARQLLGERHLLAAQVELRAIPQHGLRKALRETQGRNLAPQMNDELPTALLRLLEQALAAADWQLPPKPATHPARTAPILLG